MRLLNFIVNGQHISKDPDCDFTKIVAGTSNYLKAHFTFSPEWQDCKKAASFWRGSKEHAVLLEDDMCDIPPEALTGITFGVSATMLYGNSTVPTNRVIVSQEVNR